MGELIYAIDFSAPGDEVHRAQNEQVRQASAFLYGRGRYGLMEDVWPAARRDDIPEVEAEFARAYVPTPGLAGGTSCLRYEPER